MFLLNCRYFILNSKWKELELNDMDLRRLQNEILENPKAGTVIQGTGGIRKMRFAYDQRGKSGSIRVIYIDFEVYEKTYLITAYSKSKKDNLNPAERNELKKLVAVLARQLDNKQV